MAWTSGARSIATLQQDGWFSFEVRTPVGVAAGLSTSDASAAPIDIEFGLRMSNGDAAAIMRDVVQGTGTYTASTVQCFVGRIGSRLFATYRAAGASTTTTLSTGATVPGGAFLFEADAVAAGLQGECFLDASLFAATDAIHNVELTELVGHTSGHSTAGAIQLGPMTAMGVGEDVSAGRALFLPMTAAGQTPNTGTGSATMMLTASGISDGVSVGSVVFPPMRAAGYSSAFAPVVAGGRVSFEFMSASGSGYFGDNRGVATFEPLAAFGSEETYALGRAQFRPLTASGAGWEVPTTGAAIHITLPAVTGNFPQPSVDAEGAAIAFDTISTESTPTVLGEATASDMSTPGVVAAPVLLTDTPRVRDTMSPGGYVEFTEVAEALDETTLAHGWILSDTLTAAGTLFGSAISEQLIADVATAGDTTVVGSSYDAEYAATATDAQSFVVVVDVVETVTAGDLVDSTPLTPDVESSAQGVGEPDPDLPAPDVDSAVAATDEYVVVVADALASLTGTATASDELTLTAVSSATLTDEVWARSAVAAVIHTATAWVMNTESTATAWYSNWPFTDMAQAGSKTYAIGPEGLYVVGGESDAGTPIRARVEFDYTDFGGYNNEGEPRPNPDVSRVESVYLGMAYGAPVQLAVKVQGDPKTYRYTTKRGPSSTPRNDRITPGKGLRSRYWKLAVENTDGGDFAITDMAADVATNNRRL